MVRKTLIVIALLLVAACNRNATKPQSTSVLAPETKSTPPPTDVGSPMPPYSAASLDGKRFDLAAEHGKVVFLNVWATWCGPCRYEIPELKKMHAKYAVKGFEVVGVSVDESGSQPVKEFVKENAIGYPIVLDAQGRIANLLQTTVLPTSLVIDRSGRIVWREIGAIDPNDQSLTTAIEKALAAKG
jgi:thiol-disulfide isomerase/thioredoxin